MGIQVLALPHIENWMDDGYTYVVACAREPQAVRLEVSRRLASGRMSPIVGRRVFPNSDEPLLGVILTSAGPARTWLVDEIIRGGPLSLTDLLNSETCEVETGEA